MQGAILTIDFTVEHTNKCMDDHLYALGLWTIQELKKPSKENGNQTSIQTKLKEISSQGEHNQNKPRDRNQKGKTHWLWSRVNLDLHLHESVQLPNWQQALEGGQCDYFLETRVDRWNCQENKCVDWGFKEKKKNFKG